ncbi:clotting factor G beta subunit-like [Penaeus indicus]|uniref:clotting factor G beta subunit-like n=1 Tax=Penaeus indicus TaxID=29960 RepID=UPI00300D8374
MKNLGAVNVCEDKILLGHGESIIIYSNNDRQKEKCKRKVRTPKGATIGFSCFTFNLNSAGCRSEFLEISYKTGGQKIRRKYCTTDAPKKVFTSTNQMTLKYKRKPLKSEECSGGFVCQLFTAETSPDVARPYCDGCGLVSISASDNRIVNGSAASDGEYPYQVALIIRIGAEIFSCGGSIIKRRWILTAAHCFYDDSGNIATSIEVRYGSIDIRLGKSLTSTSFIIHPKYKPDRQAHDIGLVKLPEALQYEENPNVLPICLSLEEDNRFEGKAVATGWGDIYFGGSPVNILREVELDLIPMSVCKTKAKLPPDSNKVLCTLTPYKDTCQGDSGGPLVVRIDEKKWVQVGIVSYGFECARPDHPGVYTRVSAYLDWISGSTGGTDCDSASLSPLSNLFFQHRISAEAPSSGAVIISSKGAAVIPETRCCTELTL